MKDGIYICDRCRRPALSVFNLTGERHLVFDPVSPDDPTLSEPERRLAENGTMVRASKCGTWVRAEARHG